MSNERSTEELHIAEEWLDRVEDLLVEELSLHEAWALTALIASFRTNRSDVRTQIENVSRLDGIDDED